MRLGAKFFAWLQLLRAPNLFTVPGDVAAGYFLAGGAAFGFRGVAPAVASICFYAYGLLCNDLFDLEEDRRERADRPLPAGRVDVRAVGIVAAICAAIGLGLCATGGQAAQFVSLALAGAILLYDSWLKRLPVFGALNMGLCRGLNVLLGAAFGLAFTAQAILAAAITAMYIAAVTNLARHETKGDASMIAKSLPLLTLLLSAFVFSMQRPQVDLPAFFLFLGIAIIAVGHVTFRLNQGVPLPPSIGAMIRALLPIQAAFCASSNTGWCGKGTAVALLALWPLSRIVGRRFYAS